MIFYKQLGTLLNDSICICVKFFVTNTLINQENEIRIFMVQKFKTYQTDIMNFFAKLINGERLLLNIKEKLNEGLDLYDLKQEAHLPYCSPEK